MCVHVYHLCMCVCACVCVHVYIILYVCVCVCARERDVFLYITLSGWRGGGVLMPCCDKINQSVKE